MQPVGFRITLILTDYAEKLPEHLQCSGSTKAHEAFDHLASFMSSREKISQPGIKPPTSSLRFGYLFSSLGSSWTKWHHSNAIHLHVWMSWHTQHKRAKESFTLYATIDVPPKMVDPHHLRLVRVSYNLQDARNQKYAQLQYMTLFDSTTLFFLQLVMKYPWHFIV